MRLAATLAGQVCLEAGHTEDFQLASSKVTGADCRTLQAAMALKYDGGSRRAKDVFGWRRKAVEVGLHEKRTGIVCLGHHQFCCGAKLWEEKHPEVAQVLSDVARSHSQRDPTSRTTLWLTRLTAAEAIILVDLPIVGGTGSRYAPADQDRQRPGKQRPTNAVPQAHTPDR